MIYNYNLYKTTIFIFLFLCAFTGLDLTDQAYLIGDKNAWTNPYYLPIWGTAFITRIIEFLFGKYAFLALKIFAQFIPVLILHFFILTLGDINFSRRIKLYLLLLIPWVSRSSLGDWTYYSTLTGFFLSLSILFYYRSIKFNSGPLFHLATGLVFFSFTIKITNIVFALLILNSYFFYLKFNKNEKKPNVFIWVIPFVVIVLFFLFNTQFKFFIINGLNIFKDFLETTKTHSVDYLFKRNIVDLYDSLKTSLIMSVCIYILYKIQLQKFHSRKLIYCICSSMIFLGITSFSVLKSGEMFLFYFVVLGYLGFKFIKKDILITYLLISSIFFLVCNSFGSNNGLKASFVAEPLVVFLILYLSYNFFRLKSVSLIIIFLFFLGVSEKVRYPYRDSSRIELRKSSVIPKIHLIHTTQNKVDALDSIYKFKLDTLTDLKTALIYPSAPLLYYILDMEPFLGNPWINLYTPPVLEKMINETTKKPDVVIRLKQNPRSPIWPTGKISNKREPSILSTKFLDKFVESSEYNLFWENKYFKVYKISY